MSKNKYPIGEIIGAKVKKVDCDYMTLVDSEENRIKVYSSVT